ncbi:hypothetical protein O1157_30175 [Streptomyces albogriseolus]
MVAGILLALVARGPVLVYVYNSHLQRDKSAMRMWDNLKAGWSSVGALSTRLGDKYAYLPTVIGTMRHRGLDAPPPNAVEARTAVRDRRGSTQRSSMAPSRRPTRAPRTLPTPPLDPSHLPRIDGVVYVRDVPHE